MDKAAMDKAVETVMDAVSDQLLSVPNDKTLFVQLVISKLLEQIATPDENTDMTADQRGAALQLMAKVMDEDTNCDAVVLVRIMADGRIATGGASRKMRDGALAEIGMICRMAITEVMQMQQSRCTCTKCAARREASINMFNGPMAKA